MMGNAQLVRFIAMHGEDIDRPFSCGSASHRNGCSPLMLAMEMSGGKMTDVIEVTGSVVQYIVATLLFWYSVMNIDVHVIILMFM